MDVLGPKQGNGLPWWVWGERTRQYVACNHEHVGSMLIHRAKRRLERGDVSFAVRNESDPLRASYSYNHACRSLWSAI